MDHPENEELSEEISAYVQSAIEGFPSTDERLTEIVLGQREDPVCCELRKFCMEGWPARHKISQECVPYWEHRNRITLQEGILMKDARLIIPQCLRRDILEKLHTGHQGINKCRLLAKQSVWWPGLSTQLGELIKNCTSCIQHEPDPVEPLMPSQPPQRPWQVVGVDLLKLEGHWFLILADYYSRFFEVAKLEKLTSDCVITHMKSIFARHGVPEVVRSDNGTQFSQSVSSPYRKFAADYGFSIVTSSPRYPQSNGFIESEVKNFKKHFKKSKDPYLMLLALRTTPLQCGYSPSELLMGRKLRGVVPLAPRFLEPSLPNAKTILRKEKEIKNLSKHHFDQRHRAKPLPELPIGQKVWISDLRQRGEVQGRHKLPRSYIVKSPSGVYRRNRKFLHPLPDDHDISEDTSANRLEVAHPNVKSDNSLEDQSTSGDTMPQRTDAPGDVPQLRRSQRRVRHPVRLDL